MIAQRGQAPAKVNLTLEIIGRREDGYHEIRSVVVPLALRDELAAHVATPAMVRSRVGGSPDFVTSRGLPAGPSEDNLVFRAVDLLRSTQSRPLPSLEMRLVKRIPVAAGLGGGSSDAAAALELAAAAWSVPLGPVVLRRLAAALGSDVPFFTLRSWGMISGRGEGLVRLPPTIDGPLGVLLITPDMRLSTEAAYGAWDAAHRQEDKVAQRQNGATRARRTATGTLAARLRSGLTAGELAELAPANDLWPVAASLRPGLAQIRTTIAALLDRPVHMTGSGTTLYVLYPAPEGARRAARLVRGAIEGSDRTYAGATRPTIIATQTLGGA
jgi:4-diphosphocytidyl-2-C-methyl-D-erythritol kinase